MSCQVMTIQVRRRQDMVTRTQTEDSHMTPQVAEKT